jgi:hypothetical protein
MFQSLPHSEEIICGSRTTTGTLITIPAGKWYTGNLQITASAAVAGTSAPTVTTAGTDVAPAAGQVISRLTINGLALTTVADSIETEIIILAPPENDVTLEFTAGANGTSSATVNGFTIG